MINLCRAPLYSAVQRGPTHGLFAKVSEDTALRDLGELADKGILLRDGIGKKTSWMLAP